MGAGGERAAFRESGKKTRESGGRLLSLVGGGEEKRERKEEIITGGRRSPFYSSEEVAILLLLLLLLGPGKKAQESNFDQTRPLGGGKEGRKEGGRGERKCNRRKFASKRLLLFFLLL